MKVPAPDLTRLTVSAIVPVKVFRPSFWTKVQRIGRIGRYSGTFPRNNAFSVQSGYVAGFIRIVDLQVAVFIEQVDCGVDQRVLMGQDQGSFLYGSVSGPIRRAYVHRTGKVRVFSGDK